MFCFDNCLFFLVFKYERGMDSVLEVEKDDFDNCNTSNPKTKMEDGNSIFKFDRSGPFYFITGNKTNCDKGQKLIVVVLAVRTPPLAPVAKPPGASPPHRSFSSPAFTPSIVSGANSFTCLKRGFGWIYWLLGFSWLFLAWLISI